MFVFVHLNLSEYVHRVAFIANVYNYFYRFQINGILIPINGKLWSNYCELLGILR
jgi:hypothetical protein